MSSTAIISSDSGISAAQELRSHPNISIDYDPESRIEPVPKPDFPHREYPRWIGHKFSPSGDVLHYPGNTLMVHLDTQSPLHQALSAMVEDFKTQPFAPLLTLLPSSSLHMTIYECVTDGIRTRNSYPGDLPLDSSLKTCHAHLAHHLANYSHGLGSQGVGRMRVIGYEPMTDGIGLKLEPTTSEMESRLRDLRDRLSEDLKMRHPGHEAYSWHMALAYTVRHLSDEDRIGIEKYLTEWQKRLATTFELGVPEFCVYDDMHQFRRVFYLDS